MIAGRQVPLVPRAGCITRFQRVGGLLRFLRLVELSPQLLQVIQRLGMRVGRLVVKHIHVQISEEQHHWVALP